MKKIYQELVQGKEARQNLSTLRQMIKEEDMRAALLEMVQKDEAVVIGFLQDEDPKTRKNAALLLGELALPEGLEPLFEAYKREKTLFVKSAYLTALSHLEIGELVPCFKERLRELTGTACNPEEQKHVEEEIRELRRIVIFYEGITHHTFDWGGGECELLLLANRSQREFIRRKLTGVKSKLHPLGILCKTAAVRDVADCRLFRELLFPVSLEKLLPPEAKEAADALWALGVYDRIQSLHRENGPFYFRTEYKGAMDLGAKSAFVRKFSARLEQLSGGMLINSVSDYEIEIRLIANQKGELLAALKCFTLQDRRFFYRKNAIAASIHPSTAALIMELARPWLKENAQIMDPFCGVGTMLIERDLCVPAGPMYATDIFGEAIEKGRENAVMARRHINFIHRDFFDFRHDYQFDEIVANMPVRGNKSKEETDAFYEKFFQKALEIMNPDGVIIMYSNELGFVKKQLRLHREFHMLQETCMQEKAKFYLLIMEIKR